MGLDMSKRWHAPAVDWRRLLPLAAGTLALLLGLFCAWQTWLIAREGAVAQGVQVARDHAAQALAAEIASERAAIVRALASVDPANALVDPAAAAARARGQLPQAIQLELYSGNLDEVLHANYRDFGYAKAAQLMAAQGVDGAPLAQSVSYGNGRRLSFVVPLGPPQDAQAWAWVELPFAPLRERFEALPTGGGRLDPSPGRVPLGR